MEWMNEPSWRVTVVPWCGVVVVVGGGGRWWWSLALHMYLSSLLHALSQCSRFSPSLSFLLSSHSLLSLSTSSSLSIHVFLYVKV